VSWAEFSSTALFVLIGYVLYRTLLVSSSPFDGNDEVNLAVSDRDLCARLLADVTGDLGQSRRMVLGEWSRRSPIRRVWEQISRLLERQQ
jgi:hypothetical protein